MVKMISEARRRTRVKDIRRVHEHDVAEFDFWFKLARERFPHLADKPYFPIVLHLLLDNADNSSPETAFSLDYLPQAMDNYIRDNAWLENEPKIEGEIPEAGIQALARLLVAMRHAQRYLYETEDE